MHDTLQQQIARLFDDGVVVRDGCAEITLYHGGRLLTYGGSSAVLIARSVEAMSGQIRHRERLLANRPRLWNRT